MRLVSLASLAFVALCSIYAYSNESKTFTIQGKRFLVGLDQETVIAAYENQVSSKTNLEGSAYPYVTITRRNSSLDERSDVIRVASGFFRDGTLVLEGTIDDRTEILISVYRPGVQPITLSALAEPGETLTVVLLEYLSSGFVDQLLLVGESRVDKDNDSKFAVWGDLSSISDYDSSLTIAEISWQSYMGPTRGIFLSQSSVLLHEGRFLIEGIVNEPLDISLRVYTPTHEYVGFARAIVEPGSEIKISPSGFSTVYNKENMTWTLNLLANSESDESLHSRVIESWQDSPEYREKLKEYNSAIRQQQKNAPLDNEVESTLEDSADHENPDPLDVYDEMVKIKNSVLADLAKNLDDPMAALLAMEIGRPYSYQLEAWDKISSVLDEDIVTRRVSWRRDGVATRVRKNVNAQTVVEGHRAPQFTLSNLEGEEIVLSNVLAENNLVLVNFWASWCVPCVASIPKLKELYSEYRDDGFEIVFVSIDETHADWEAESNRIELPWINVRDLNGWHSTSVIYYGVQWLPTEFAINIEGEILDRGLTPDELENLLANQFVRKLEPEDANQTATSVDKHLSDSKIDKSETM